MKEDKWVNLLFRNQIRITKNNKAATLVLLLENDYIEKLNLMSRYWNSG